MSELDAFLEEEVVEETEETTEQTTEEKSEESSEETQEEETVETTGEKPSEEEGLPPEPETKSDMVPMAALLDERSKRQQREAELEALKQQQEEKEPAPDVIEDQEGFVKHFETRLQQATQTNRIQMSQELMRMMHDDYDSVEQQFVDMVKDSPELVAQMNQSSNPAKFAYDTVKKAEKLAQLENVDEMESKLRAEIEEKVRAELAEEQEAEAKAKQEKAESLTPSLSGQRAAGANTAVIPEVEDPLETTFNR